MQVTNMKTLIVVSLLVSLIESCLFCSYDEEAMVWIHYITKKMTIDDIGGLYAACDILLPVPANKCKETVGCAFVANYPTQIDFGPKMIETSHTTRFGISWAQISTTYDFPLITRINNMAVKPKSFATTSGSPYIWIETVVIYDIDNVVVHKLYHGYWLFEDMREVLTVLNIRRMYAKIFGRYIIVLESDTNCGIEKAYGFIFDVKQLMEQGIKLLDVYHDRHELCVYKFIWRDVDNGTKNSKNDKYLSCNPLYEVSLFVNVNDLYLIITELEDDKQQRPKLLTLENVFPITSFVKRKRTEVMKITRYTCFDDEFVGMRMFEFTHDLIMGIIENDMIDETSDLHWLITVINILKKGNDQDDQTDIANRNKRMQFPHMLQTMSNIHGYNVKTDESNYVWLLLNELDKDDDGLKIYEKLLTTFTNYEGRKIHHISVASLNKALASLSWYDPAILTKEFAHIVKETLWSQQDIVFGWNRYLYSL